MKIHFSSIENEKAKKQLPIILAKKIMLLICQKENISNYI